jgi:hypothetical protein
LTTKGTDGVLSAYLDPRATVIGPYRTGGSDQFSQQFDE